MLFLFSGRGESAKQKQQKQKSAKQKHENQKRVFLTLPLKIDSGTFAVLVVVFQTENLTRDIRADNRC